MDQEFSKELKQRQRYWLEHLRAAIAQGVTLAEYARVAQVDSDALYRWRALFKRQGVSIIAEPDAAPASFAAVRVATDEVRDSAAVTIHVGTLIRVRCRSWPDPGWLAQLSHRLQERP